ncbi:hypothetical protein Patl1_19593 [Pistacia atlantica]|uniref:Uncharacterized protein n=1 Tax=Pistacia atlantica TaxID=434234 RepID=A0ACC1BZX4_9ROSI|nr:hypothetical protein Patl1_19593 [Pistacia atlantica]
MASQGCVGFVGLDELSLDMAASLLRSGYNIQAFEIHEPLINEFLKLGGSRCASPQGAGKDVAALVVLISHADQIDDVIFGHDGALKENGETAYLVDAYVSRGMSEVLKGKVMITSSGRSNAIARARPFLSAMCEKLYVFEGEVGARSKSKMVNELLEGIHLIASVEAISLGAKVGIHPFILYDIISNAAGNSWIFKNHIPQLLRGDVKLQFLNPVIQNLGIILDMAKTLTFPLPLLAVARQQLLHGSHVHGDDGSTPLVKVWEKVMGVNIIDAANLEPYQPEQLAQQIIAKSNTVKRVGFIGLGAMGFGMATHLLKFCSVVGYDYGIRDLFISLLNFLRHVPGQFLGCMPICFQVYKPTLTRFENAGGLIANSPEEVSKDIDVLVVMVTNESQAESVLYGDHGAVPALPSGASIILSSTVSLGFVVQLERRLQLEGKDLKLVDAPVSGGVKRASTGELTIMAAGTDEALTSTGSVLSALSEKLYVIKGGCGAGSGVKMVNQLLAGVHIASTAEAMAFGARLGLNTRVLFDIISNSGGTSWMFENRGPHMLDNDYTPHSALDIFVKDLGIVTHESSAQKVPLHISTIAHQLFLAGSAAGWGRQDDAGVVKVYETLTGVKVEGKLPMVKKEVVLQSLPSEWPVDPIDDTKGLIQNSSKTLVVLDDDPTGTQTVHDIEVLTEWSVESLVEQFTKKPLCFFILTNSRALSSEKAGELTKEICRNLCTAANSVENTKFTVVLRDAAVSVLGEMDASIICPFFLQGGRYTIEDVHYVADVDRLVPAGDTEFAKDAAFGYKSSNLREWVEEKTAGRISASSVASISVQLLRKGGPDAVCEHLCSLQKAELKGKSFICRTAASFVSARIGIIPKAPILPKDLGINRETNGAIIVVGSYVPKTTKQVGELKSQCGHIIRSIEVSVDKVAMKSLEEREEEINRTVEMVDVLLRCRKDTLVMTSRELITGKTPSESLEINFKVSSALVEIVRRITTRPRYILAKGGITSSDTATKALEAKRAKVVGQALAGVPLWQLGPESRHPGVPYIVFPGNVGDNNALAQVVKSWARPARLSSTKELLINADQGKYAVGAFNVYNMEGVEAVVAAAEEERSPAILQIHPSALKEGGIPLVACCISAAERASVPITVHFDHGNAKQELMEALELGFDSVMADGSHLPFKDNILYTKFISRLAHSKDLLVEAELGRLSGTEDDLTVEDYEAKLTDINQAEEFIDETGIDALAVCIGNVHGKYPPSGPNLRLDLLKDLHALSSKKGVYLVLHGASGLSVELIKGCIERGVTKFNVNTEVRTAYMESLKSPKKDLVHVMAAAKDAMKAVVAEKMHLFGSAGKA